MQAHLTLREHALDRLVHELDGVLDRDDVQRAPLVHGVDERGLGRALSRARRPGEQDHPVVELEDPLDGVGQLQIVQGRHVLGDHPEHRAHAVLVEEYVGAEAAPALQVVGEVHLVLVVQLVALLVVQDLVQETPGLGVGQAAERDGDQLAVVADGGTAAGQEVQIAGLLLDDQAQEGVEAGHQRSSSPQGGRSPGRLAP
jgi:hypothetical protein